MKGKTVLVTGAHGFIGRNLCVRLRREAPIRLFEVDVETPPESLETGLREADVLFHLAGVNRPEKTEDYLAGNAGFTEEICQRLTAMGRAPHIVLSSSIQALLDNPYGVSKRMAEEALLRHAERSGSQLTIFRMKNVFGKWCRPNYNSVVATFCHNTAHDLPIAISDPSRVMELVYVDDVCAAMIRATGVSRIPPIASSASSEVYREVSPVYRITLGDLADRIKSFRDLRHSLFAPNFDDELVYKLYATYLSYLEGVDFSYRLDLNTDRRGSLAEFLKSPSFGQIFVSRTMPGITRGNHYHDTKTEKFLVVQGKALIRLRHILGTEIIEHRVSGEEFRVMDIPPGYTHSIENVGEGELVTLFWADQILDPAQPDTFMEEVLLPDGERDPKP